MNPDKKLSNSTPKPQSNPAPKQQPQSNPAPKQQPQSNPAPKPHPDPAKKPKIFKKDEYYGTIKGKEDRIYVFSDDLYSYYGTTKRNEGNIKILYNKVLAGEHMICEHNATRINMKLDIDAHVGSEDEINKVTNDIYEYIKVKMVDVYKIEIDDSEYFIETCKPDTHSVINGQMKYSRHITINSDKFYWRAKRDINNFLIQIGIYDKFKGYIDPKIYGPIGLRIPFSPKFFKSPKGVKKVLDKGRGGFIPWNSKITDPYELFKKCLMCMATTNKDAVELTHEPPTNVNMAKTKKSNPIKPLESTKSIILPETQIMKKPKIEAPIDINESGACEPTTMNEPVNDESNNSFIHENISLNIIQMYVDILSIKRCDEYDTWIQVGAILKCCNIESFNIWDTWSQKVKEKYNKKDTLEKWDTITKKTYTYGSLKYIAKNDNMQKYIQLTRELDAHKNPENVMIDKKEPYNVDLGGIQLNDEYLLESLDDNLMDGKGELSQSIIKWTSTAELKRFILCSCYGSGKTRIISKVIKEFNIIRVLFISYRIALSHELLGAFKDLGVKSYLDNEYDADRLVVQIESLHKLLKVSTIGYGYNTQIKITVPDYDLVIIDESESVLNHFSSPTVKNKEQSFKIMHAIVHNSKKLLCLDGDISQRTLDFAIPFGDGIIIENKYKRCLKHFIFEPSKINFDSDINEDLQDGKNIAIVSLSMSTANEYHEKYKGIVKAILHCSKSDDELKEKLQDVNELWAQYQLVIFTPCIESGLNFDCEHFDKIYVVLCQHSTSQRSTMQMIARIRQLRDSNVQIYTNNLPLEDHNIFYTYDELKSNINELMIPMEKLDFILDHESNKITVSKPTDEYMNNYIHSEVERYNKHPQIFIPYLIRLMKHKGHTVTVNKANQEKKDKGHGTDLLKQELIDAKDINDRTFQDLLKKERQSCTTREEKAQIEKHVYKKLWNVADIDKEFLDNFYNKNNVLRNLKQLIKTTSNSFGHVFNDIVIDNGKALRTLKIVFIKDLISLLGFKLDTNIDPIGLDKETFMANITTVASKSLLYKKIGYSSRLFEIGKTKFSLKGIKQYMGFFNSLLHNYGLCIKSTNISKKVSETKKVAHIMTYSMTYWKDINKYLLTNSSGNINNDEIVYNDDDVCDSDAKEQEDHEKFIVDMINEYTKGKKKKTIISNEDNIDHVSDPVVDVSDPVDDVSDPIDDVSDPIDAPNTIHNDDPDNYVDTDSMYDFI